MAILLRVSVQGSLPGGEVWSVNPVYRLGTGGDVPATALQCQQIVTAINAITVSSGVLTMMSTSTAITGCRVEARGLGGVLEALAEGQRGSAVAGSGATTHPYQTSLVTSLRTSTPGPSGRGRLYWPLTGGPLSATTLRVASGQVNTYLLGVKTYLSAIDTAIEATLGGAALAVWSRKTGAIHAVTSLQMGDVPDVQRRRRDQLIEGITATTYP